jgi:myo-inositol-1(or 4)-monophosphatase
LVTAADKASEKLIVATLKAAFPDHSIVAEEGGGQQTGSDYTWYVDPLDGTTNFAMGSRFTTSRLGSRRVRS